MHRLPVYPGVHCHHTSVHSFPGSGELLWRVVIFGAGHAPVTEGHRHDFPKIVHKMAGIDYKTWGTERRRRLAEENTVDLFRGINHSFGCIKELHSFSCSPLRTQLRGHPSKRDILWENERRKGPDSTWTKCTPWHWQPTSVPCRVMSAEWELHWSVLFMCCVAISAVGWSYDNNARTTREVVAVFIAQLHMNLSKNMCANDIIIIPGVKCGQLHRKSNMSRHAPICCGSSTPTMTPDVRSVKWTAAMGALPRSRSSSATLGHRRLPDDRWCRPSLAIQLTHLPSCRLC